MMATPSLHTQSKCRNGLNRSALALACLIGGPTAAQAQIPPAQPRPNFIQVMIDDVTAGAFQASTVPVPSIDRLAAEGTSFAFGYAAAAICAPSRAGWLTGRYQQRWGEDKNDGEDTVIGSTRWNNFGLPGPIATVAERLRAVGYATGLIGKWHEGYVAGRHPIDQGFAYSYAFLGGNRPYRDPVSIAIKQQIRQDDVAVGMPGFTTQTFTNEAIAFIDRSVAAGQPFYVLLPYNAAHTPITFDPAAGTRCNHEGTLRRKKFCSLLVGVDDGIGRLLNELDRLSIAGSTLVSVSGDNGCTPSTQDCLHPPFRGAKFSHYEGGIRVPLILRQPGVVPAGLVHTAGLATLTDLGTTALAQAGLVPGDQDGVNLIPFVQAGTAAHTSWHWFDQGRDAYIELPWKLVRDGNGPELYNLAVDPGESHNLAAAEPAQLSHMQAVQDAWRRTLPKPQG